MQMFYRKSFLYVLLMQPHCLQIPAPDGQMCGRVDFFTDFDASGGQSFFGTVDVRGHNGQYVQGFFPYLEAGEGFYCRILIGQDTVERGGEVPERLDELFFLSFAVFHTFAVSARSFYQTLVGLTRSQEILAQEYVPVGKEDVTAMERVGHDTDVAVISGGYRFFLALAGAVGLFRNVRLSDDFREMCVWQYRFVFVVLKFHARSRGEKRTDDVLVPMISYITGIVMLVTDKV